eukprot:s418_g2.t1
MVISDLLGWTGGVRVLSIVRTRNREPVDEFCGEDPPEVDAGQQLPPRSSEVQGGRRRGMQRSLRKDKAWLHQLRKAAAASDNPRSQQQLQETIKRM